MLANKVNGPVPGDCTVQFAVIPGKSLDLMLRGIVFHATHRPHDIWAFTFPGVRGHVLFEVFAYISESALHTDFNR